MGEFEGGDEAGLLVQAAEVTDQIYNGVLFLEGFIGESIIKVAEVLLNLTKPEFVTISLPVTFQNFTLKVQSVLSRRLDWVKFTSLCKIINVLSAAAQDFCSFCYIHDSMGNKILKIRNCQGDFRTDTV